MWTVGRGALRSWIATPKILRDDPIRVQTPLKSVFSEGGSGARLCGSGETNRSIRARARPHSLRPLSRLVALLVHGDGVLEPAWTPKTYLVPFVEGVPFGPLLGPLLSGGQGELKWMAGGFEAPSEQALLPMDGTKIGVLVCYEELYFDLARRLRNAGAAFQAIVTNDAWFGRSVFQMYQANTVRLRAIENRSAFVPAVETWDVPLTSVRTVYDRVGDVLAWIALLGLGAAVVVSVRRGRSEHERAGLTPGGPDVGGLPGPGAVADGPGPGPGGNA